MTAPGVTTAPRTPDVERGRYSAPPFQDMAEGSNASSRSAGDGSDGSPVDDDGAKGRSWTVHLPDIPLMKLAGAALFGLGILTLLFIVYLFAFTPLSASRNQQRLAQTVSGQPLKVYKLVAGSVPPEGEPVGILTIPSINVRQVFVEGTSASDLMNGPGLMPGTVVPGGPGNSVVAARSLTFGAPFGQLGELRPGYRIRIVDGAGTFNYRVTRSLRVTAGQHDVVAPTADNRLTLVTSSGGIAPDGRLVVVAKLLGTPVAVNGTQASLPSSELGLSGDPAAGGLAVLWSLATLLVLIGAGWAAWRWRRPGLVYVFAAPIVVACGLLACESLARALPATL